jgi:hypothetical protein
MGTGHKVRIFTVNHSVCPLVGTGSLPTPLSPASVPLPPEPKGGEHSPAGEGLGESQFRRLEKKLTLWSSGRVFVGVGTMYGVREELVSSMNIQERVYMRISKKTCPLLLLNSLGLVKRVFCSK